jgi:hypothetical protein
MNPVQRYLLLACEADPAGSVPVTTFMEDYCASLDDNEDERWRHVPHVLRVLSKQFPIGLGVGCRRVITGLRAKPVHWPTVDAVYALAEAA